MVVKAGGVVLVSAILAGAVGGGAIWMLNQQIASKNFLADVLRNHLESDMMHDALRSDVLSALAASDPAFGISIDNVKKDLEEHSAHFLNMIDSNMEMTEHHALGEVVAAVKPSLEAYIDTAVSLIETAETDQAAALAMLPGFLESFSTLETVMSEASDRIAATADEAVTQANTLGMAALIAMLVAGLVAVCTVISIVLAARRSIVRPIVDLTVAMDKLAGGDTNVQAPHRDRQDEIGRMAAALTKFRENAINRMALEAAQREQEAERAERSRKIEALASAFGDQLAASLATLRESSARLMSDASSLEDVCEEANESARTAIDAAAGANSNVQTIAAATTELSASIQEIASRMTESARSAEQASSQGAAAGMTAQQLAEAARGIDEIVSLIGSVAEQTNLLALNATIEAARAGEMGRGFAVVASEVKGLASQTSRATEDVSRRIAEIQGISSRSTEQINHMVQLIEQMKQLSVAVAAAAEEQSAATNNIAENVNSAASRSDEARSSVAAMSSVTAKTREATDSVQASARSVEELAQNLSLIARDFLTKLKAA